MHIILFLKLHFQLLGFLLYTLRIIQDNHFQKIYSIKFFHYAILFAYKLNISPSYLYAPDDTMFFITLSRSSFFFSFQYFSCLSISAMLCVTDSALSIRSRSTALKQNTPGYSAPHARWPHRLAAARYRRCSEPNTKSR